MKRQSMVLLVGIISVLFYQTLNGYDLNKDGWDDIIISNHRTYKGDKNVNSYIYWGDSSSSFSNKTELVTHGATGNNVADFNGDGYLDILFCNTMDYPPYSSEYVNSYIYWGAPSNTYSTRTEIVTNTYVIEAASIADINRDGYLDIVFSNNSNINDQVSINSFIYWGDSVNPYSITTRTEMSTNAASANAVYDINKDGYLDIVFTNNYTKDSYPANTNINSYIYWGSSENTYSSKTELRTVGGADCSIADLNMDGYTDIVFTNLYDSNQYPLPSGYAINSYIYWGDESYKYLSKTGIATVGAADSTIYDINKDGYLDILIISGFNGDSYEINSYIYWGDQNYNYLDKTPLATQGANRAAVSDLNNDGYPDIIIANHNDNQNNGGNYNINSYIYWGAQTNPFSTKTELPTIGAVDISAGNMSSYGNSIFLENQSVPEPVSILLLCASLILMAVKKIAD